MSVGLLGEDVGRVRGKTGRQQEAHSIAFDVSAIAIKNKKPKSRGACQWRWDIRFALCLGQMAADSRQSH